MPITGGVEIAFRVAAGPRLGFGHLARCRAIAAALGVTPRISLRGTKNTRAVARRLGVEVLASTQRHVLGGLDVLVVDDPSRAAGRAWVLAARRAGVAVVAVHDAARMPHPADLVVDGSPRTPSLVRAHRRGGPRFAVLDSRIAPLRRGHRRDRPSLLIALGGGAHGLARTRALLRSLAATPTIARIDVAPGFAPSRRPRLVGARWLSPAGVAPALAGARLAIVGGGLTALEAAALGVPAIAVAVVPAQRPAIRALAARGVVVDGGTLADPRAAGRVAAHVRHLWHAPSARRSLASAGRRFVDGQGAARIAEAIRRLAQDHAR